MRYSNTMFSQHVKSDGKSVHLGYSKSDLRQKREWVAKLREAAPRSPWTVAEVLHEYPTGLSASNSLTKIVLNLATYLASLANSEFCDTTESDFNERDSKSAEQQLHLLVKKKGALSGGDYVSGLRILSGACRWPEFRALVSSSLPEECARFVTASEELRRITADVQPHAWQKFVETKLAGTTLAGCKLDQFLGVVLSLRNDEAHGRSGGVVAGTNTVSVNINQGNDELWHSVFAHYLAPAVRALLLHPPFAQCVESLQVVDVGARHMDRFEIAWPKDRGGPDYPSEMMSRREVTGRVVARYDVNEPALLFLAPFLEFPQPRNELAEQRRFLAHKSLNYLLDNGTAPKPDDIKRWRAPLSAGDSIDPVDALDDAMKLLTELNGWAAGGAEVLPAHLKPLAEPSPPVIGQLQGDAASADDVRRRVHAAADRLDRLVFDLVKRSMSTVAIIGEIVGHKDLAIAALTRLESSGKVFALREGSANWGLIRTSFVKEAEELAAICDACKSEPGMPPKTATHVANVLGILRSLLNLLGVEEELKRVARPPSGAHISEAGESGSGPSVLQTRVEGGLDEWAAALRASAAVATATSEVPTGAGAIAVDEDDPLQLTIDGEYISGPGLTRLFRGLETLYNSTTDLALKQRLAGLCELTGERAIRIGYRRVLLATRPMHSETVKFGYAVTVTLAGRTVYFEANMVKEQGVVALARALASLGCVVTAKVDGTLVFPQGEVEELSDERKSAYEASESGDSVTESAPDLHGLSISILHDGAAKLVQGASARKFLTALVSEIVAAGKLQELERNTPVLVGKRAGARRYVIAKAPRHADGKAFVSTECIHTAEAGDFYLELNWSHDGAYACATRLCEAAGLEYATNDDEEHTESEGELATVEAPTDADSPTFTDLGFEFGDSGPVTATSVSDLLRKCFDALDSKGALALFGDTLTVTDLIGTGSGRASYRSLWSPTAVHLSGREYKDAREYRAPQSGKEFYFESSFGRPVAQALVTALVQQAAARLELRQRGLDEARAFEGATSA